MVYKCKMCGGDLDLQPGLNVAECSFCGTVQTVPSLSDDKKTRLYNRANQYRLNNEFDKAYSAYETIISEKEDEAEAYWGLVLSEYGVEYVEDPATKKRIPTCHRTLVKPVTSNENFKLACQYADGESRMMYEDEAEQLDLLQRKIINASAKEDPYDVFICYKETDDNGERTQDSVLAHEIYNELTRNGLRVFFSRISLEDKLGTEYEPCIFAALTSAKVMLVVTTDSEHCNSVWVKNEWKRYVEFMKNDPEKVLIPVYRDISPYTLPTEFAKLQAQDMSKLGAIQDLVHGVEKIVKRREVPRDDLAQTEKELLKRLEKNEKIKKRITKASIFGVAALVLFYLISRFSDIGVGLLPIFTYRGRSISFASLFSKVSNAGFVSWTWTDFHLSNMIMMTLVVAVVGIGIFFIFSKIKKPKLAFAIYASLLTFLSIFVIAVSFFRIRPTIYFWIGYIVILAFAAIFAFFSCRNKKKTLIICVVVFLMLLIPTLVFGLKSNRQDNKRDTSRDQIRVTITRLNIRQNASKYSPIVGGVYEGEVYTVLERSYDEEYAWYKIKTAYGETGYVSAGEAHDYVEFMSSKDIDNQSNSKNKNVPQIQVLRNNLNVRKSPSDESEIVGKVYFCEIFDVKSVEYEGERIWYEITTNYGTSGFVASTRENSNVTKLFPEGSFFTQSNPRNSKVLQIKVSAEYVNMRKDSSLDAEVVSQVEEGDVFSVLGVKYELPHTWYKVKTNGGIVGYIASGSNHEYLEYLAPKGKPSQQSNERDYSKEQFEVYTAKYLYSSADDESKVVGVLHSGEVYDILSTTEDEETFEIWYKIKTNRGVKGYVKN